MSPTLSSAHASRSRMPLPYRSLPLSPSAREGRPSKWTLLVKQTVPLTSEGQRVPTLTVVLSGDRVQPGESRLLQKRGGRDGVDGTPRAVSVELAERGDSEASRKRPRKCVGSVCLRSRLPKRQAAAILLRLQDGHHGHGCAHRDCLPVDSCVDQPLRQRKILRGITDP